MEKKLKLPIGIENFSELRKRNYYYVDKTELIEQVLEDGSQVILFTRPRRFGKSVTANMLTAYYSRGCDSEELFSGFEISKDPDFKKHLNKYDVIHLDIQWCIEPAG